MVFERILLATDLTEGMERATDIAVDMARQTGATVTLLHVHQLPLLGSAENVSMADAHYEGSVTEALHEELARLHQRWPRCESLLVRGVPWQQILLAIDARHMDLVVMGTHGRRGLKRALLGSVAEKVVRLSPVPVLTASTRPRRAAA